MDNFAMVDVERPDLARFPALRRARALEAILEPGDVLWLPRFYWHYVKQLDAPSENVSLNFWVGKKGTQEFFHKMRTMPLPEMADVAAAALDAARTARSMNTGDEMKDATAAEAVQREDEATVGASTSLAFDCLHASRMIESAASKLMADNRDMGNKFLLAIAHGADANWPENDGATQKARRLRQELMAVLGGGRIVNALLRLVSRDGRLYPGLAPKTGDDYVNSEKGVQTPLSEVERWFAGGRPDLGG